jgi:hypothetical protein
VGDLLGYICKFADEVKQGPAAQLYYPLTPEGLAQAEAFARGHDQKGFSIYSCIGALRTAPRNKENVGALDKVVVDLDLRAMIEDREQVLETLRKLPLLPEIRDSGRGIHTVWHLKEALVDEAGLAQAEAIMRRLAALLAGDPVPTHRAALLRHLGTHNSRDGGWRECHIIAPGTVCDITEFSDLFDLYDGAALLHYKDGKVPAAPITAAPVDIDASLAAIAPGNINDTRTKVAAAMIARGITVESALEQIIEEMRTALGEHAKGWDWAKERADCEWSCYRFVNNKMKEGVDLSNCLPKVHFDRWQDMLRAGRQPVLSRNSFGFFVRNGKNEAAQEHREVGDHGAATAPAAKPETGRRRRFKLVRACDLRMGVNEEMYLINEFIPKTGLVTVYGTKKCFKSFTILDAMLHVAKGWTWHDRPVRQGSVIYCAFEGSSGLAKRLRAAFLHYGLTDEDRVPLFAMPGNANLIADHRLLIHDFRDELAEAGEKNNPAVVVLDTLNKSLYGSESKDTDMANYIRAAEAIREEFGCVVVIIHHSGLDDTRPRGHTSLAGAVDAQLSVTRTDYNATVAVELMRDGPEGISLTVHLKEIGLGVFDHRTGKEMTSLVVVPVAGHDSPPPIRTRAWPRALVVFKDALSEAILSHGQEFSIEGGPKVRAVDSEHVRAVFYKTYLVDPEGEDPAQARRKAFLRCLQKAQAQRLIGVHVEAGRHQIWLARTD